LTAPIQFDDVAQSGGSGCVSAEVFYGDQRVDARLVQVDVTPDAARQLSQARIFAAVPVDEPFVTLVLRAGCGRQSSRRYVLLAEAPKGDRVLLGAATSLAAERAPRPLPGPAAPAPESRLARAAAPRPTPPPLVATAPRVAPAAQQARRLQLAVWDPGTERQPWLRAAMELKSQPSDDAARRATATALWRALNAQPQDLLRTAERLRGLEGEDNALRILSDRHRSEILSAGESLPGAQRTRQFALLLTVLLALLAGSAAAAVWHRSRRAAVPAAADSWYASLEPGVDGEVIAEQRAPVADPVQAPLVEVPAAFAAPPTASAPVARPVPTPLPFAIPDATQPPTAVHLEDRTGLKIEALHGAQQQSEFFAALGQIDEAVSVLTSYLEASTEKPVLAFLELFHIFHGTGMRVEYEELQSTFRQTFGMDVPSFSQYKDEHRELELYLLPVTRIASAWPSDRSQQIIAELLFKRPETPRDLLSLDACRELLWLYALGQDVARHTGSPAGLQLLGDRGLPNGHFILPWAVGQAEGPSELSLDRLDSIDVAP
ncbi:MAG: hypothetical protein H7322_13445, partial [Ramlibacter sp.]|nr:hypothetical protein [Ramlibacter sp.]